MGYYIVVGGTAGIGAEIVQQLLAAGHRIKVLSRGNNAFDSSAIDHEVWNADSLDLPEVDDQVIDGFVYCPGTILLKPFHRITDEEFLQALQINVLSAIRLLKHYQSSLKKSNRASVVLFSTVAVQTGMSFHTSVGIAKGAVEGLVRSLAAEWAPSIRVNAIAPSLTQTSLAANLTSTPEKIEASAKRHPLGRIGQPEDLASAALFLLLPSSSWMTGQILHVDGGLGTLRT